MTHLSPDPYVRPITAGRWIFIPTGEGVDIYPRPRLPEDKPIMSVPLGQVCSVMEALGHAGVASHVMAADPRSTA